jgi:hypothetical protein
VVEEGPGSAGHPHERSRRPRGGRRGTSERRRSGVGRQDRAVAGLPGNE